MLQRLQTLWLFQLTRCFSLFAGTGEFPECGVALAFSFLNADELRPDKKSSYLPRFHLLLLFIAYLRSSSSPAGLVVLPRAASCAPAAVWRGLESGWGQWLAADSFFLCFHLFPLFPLNEIRCQHALGRLFNVRGSHEWGTQGLAFIFGGERLLRSNLHPLEPLL